MILLGRERACLAILHNLRDNIPNLRRILSKNAVMNKDRMDVDCILHLTKESVLEVLQLVGSVVHSIVPDQYRISTSNKVGLYPHPIAVTCGSYGKVPVLDFQPMKQITRLLEVKLHVPAEVKILLECKVARSLAFVKGIIYIWECSNAIIIFPTRKPEVKSMKKAELENVMSKKGLSVNVSLGQLRTRLQNVLTREQKEYKSNGVAMNQVQLSEEIYPSCIAAASDDMLVVASNTKHTVFTCELDVDCLIVKGKISKMIDYPPTCKEILSLSVKGNILVASYDGDPGGIFQFHLDTREITVVLSNETHDCCKAYGVAMIQDGEFVFSDMENHTIKRYKNAVVEILAGTGKEGNDYGLAEKATFCQPMGLCIEYGINIFVTDAQSDCLKLITTIRNTVEFLKHLRLLYSAFSVHLKHTAVPKLSLREAYEKVESLSNFLKNCETNVQEIIGIKKATNGPEGTVACKTMKSVDMIKLELLNIARVVEVSEIPVDLQSLLTVQVENLHATSHFKEQFPTCLQYARNLSDTVHESVKRAVNWSAFYYTHPQSYYPVPESRRSLCEMPVMDHLSPVRVLTDTEQQTMKDWANDFGKCVSQRTVRQETTKFKAGTLPLNMYNVKTKPGEKISFTAQVIQDEQVGAVEERTENDQNLSTESDHIIAEPEQLSEYDSNESDE